MEERLRERCRDAIVCGKLSHGPRKRVHGLGILPRAVKSQASQIPRVAVTRPQAKAGVEILESFAPLPMRRQQAGELLVNQGIVRSQFTRPSHVLDRGWSIACVLRFLSLFAQYVDLYSFLHVRVRVRAQRRRTPGIRSGACWEFATRIPSDRPSPPGPDLTA